MTDVQRRTLEALAKWGPMGPASLSGHVWPGHVGLRKGAAPGTGLVRPMLAVLARLKRAGVVEWFSPSGDDPIVWGIRPQGVTALRALGWQGKARLRGGLTL